MICPTPSFHFLSSGFAALLSPLGRSSEAAHTYVQRFGQEFGKTGRRKLDKSRAIVLYYI